MRLLPQFYKQFSLKQFSLLLTFSLLVSSFLPNFNSSLPVNSQALGYPNGIVTGISNSQFLFFCEDFGQSNGENKAYRNISFLEQTEFYVANTKNGEVETGNKCTKSTKITGIPRFANHQTKFEIDLENDQIVVKNVKVMNNLPKIQNSNVCVPLNQKARIEIVDDENDIAKIDFLNSPSNGNVAVINRFVEYTPNFNYTGSDSFVVELSDKFFGISLALDVKITDKNGQVSSFSQNMAIEPSGTNLKYRRTLILNISANCPNSSISSISTFNSANYSNSKANSSSPMVVYVELNKPKVKYSGKSVEYFYSPERQEYDFIVSKNIDYAKSEIAESCHYLPKFITTVILRGCGIFPNGYFPNEKNEVYVVSHKLEFPTGQENEYREFYRKLGFVLENQASGVVWQVEYYRFADGNGNLGDWQFYAGGGGFEAWQNAKWMKYSTSVG